MTPFDRIWEPAVGTDGTPIVWPGAWRVHHTVETGSTNTDLLAAFARGEVGDRVALVTDHQTAGRGRLDRRWDAPPGANLLVSLLFTDIPDPAVELTHRVGLAAVGAVRAITDERDVALKWPNDVLVGDRKLAGILAQRGRGGPRGDEHDAVVAGMGMNLGWAPDGAARLGEGVSPAQMLAAVLSELDAQPADIGPAYRAELATLGREVRVELPDGGQLSGTAVAVDDRGRLVVRTSAGTVHALDVGDVVHARLLA